MGGIICALVFVALVVGGVLSFRRKRERESWYYSSRCAGCGYDLRNGVSDRCPECGKLWWEQ